MIRLSVRQKLLLSYLLLGVPLSIYVIFILGPAKQEANNAYFFILGLLITALLSIISGIHITGPLSALRHYVENLTNLDFKPAKPIKTGDEFELFFKKFNQMNSRLKSYTKEFDEKNKELEAIISNMQSGVIISDAQGNIKTMNKVAEKIVDYALDANYKKRLLRLHHLSGETISLSDSPVHKTLQGESYSNYLLEYHHPKTDKIKVLNFNGTPLLDDKGKIYGSILIFLDVTSQHRLQERLKKMVSFQKVKTHHLSLLHKMSLVLNKERDINKILKTLIKSAVSITEAGKGTIFQKKGREFVLASSYNFENTCPKVDEESLTKLYGRALCKKLLKNKKAIRINDFFKFNGGSYKKTRSDQSIKALMILPIIDSKQVVIGLMGIFNKENGKSFNLEDEKVTQILSSHASVAINNALTYEREHKISQLLQKSMLPSKSFAKSLDSHIDVSLAYKPATQGAMVGGDFYDFIDLGKNKTACIIADVNGKGVQAATMTSLVRNTIKAFAYEDLSPDNVLEKTNKALYNQTSDATFVTAVYGVIDLSNGHFIYANAGHHPPLLYRANQNEVIALNEGSTPLGLMSNEHYKLHRIELELNDSLVLYTDGLVEGRREGQFFGEDGLIKSILSHAPMPVNIAGKILADVEHFTDNNLTDDIALLILKVKQPFSKLVHRLAVKSNFVGW